MQTPGPGQEESKQSASPAAPRRAAAWLPLLPKFIGDRLRERHTLQAIISNSGWLIADRLVRLIVGLLMTVWIARYLGPEEFGLWNYAIAFTAIFSAFSTLGLDSIVVRELVRAPSLRDELLGTAFALKVAGGLVCLVVTAVAIGYARPAEPLTAALVFISAGGFVFQSTSVIDMYFQSRMQSKFTVYATNLAFLIVAIVKVVLLISSAKLIAFALAGLAEAMLSAVFLVLCFRRCVSGEIAWRWSRDIALNLLRDSWPLILAGLSVMIYMRIDQIMIGEILGNSSVGVYSVAMRISELWYFLPGAIVSSVYPGLIACREIDPKLYLLRLQRLFGAVIWLGIAIAVFITLGGQLIVEGLFGQSYVDATEPLQIHVWGGIFVGLGIASGIWFAAENLARYSLYRTLSGCVLNVSLNVIAIPKFGVSGAALSTVLSQVLATFVFDIATARTRELFFIKLRSFNPALLIARGR